MQQIDVYLEQRMLLILFIIKYRRPFYKKDKEKIKWGNKKKVSTKKLQAAPPTGHEKKKKVEKERHPPEFSS